MRPVIIDDGLARRVRLSPASLACVFRSSMVSRGLFRGGKIDSDFSNNFPISLNRPGFSSRAGGEDDSDGSPCGSAGRSGAACSTGAWTPKDGEDGGGAACGHPAPAVIINIDNAMPAVARCVLDRAKRLPVRSGMTWSVTGSSRPAKHFAGCRLSEHSKRDDKTQHEHAHGQRHPKSQMFLDPDPDPFAVAVEENSDHEKTPAARNHRQCYEQPDIVIGKTRGNGDKLVGYRRQALQQDDPRAIFGIAGAEGLDLAAKTVKLDQPVPDGIIEYRADGIAENVAQ